ncbi:ATP-binding protein [Nocardia puris]|uniref:ATP-binding protein n=2 Tax=Nocardia puris TaxID=208602 RepID=UPI001F188AB6|nr:ATP-binding protein [Nocardia puris]
MRVQGAGEVRGGATARRIPFPFLIGGALVTVAAVLTAVFSVPAAARTAVAVVLGAAAVALWVATATAVHYRAAALAARRAGREATAAASDRVAAVGDAAWAAESRAAAAIAEARAAADTARAEGEAKVAEAQTATRASESRRKAERAAFANIAGRTQAMTTSMLAELREMEERHSDTEVLADLLRLDHRATQVGRLADSIAVLSGARSGRRWAKPIPLERILRGAMGRVADYTRIRLRAGVEIAVIGPAAEGVMHLLAELMDNACRFSPPTTEVHVYASDIPAGVLVTIEDSGLVMSDAALRYATRMVGEPDSGAGPPDLSSVRGTKLGLAVVGHLAAKHKLRVSFRPSALGGTAAVVVIPREITTRTPVTRPTPPAPDSAPVAAVPDSVPIASVPEASAERSLPKRRRGSAFAAAHPGGFAEPVRTNSPEPVRSSAPTEAPASSDTDRPANALAKPVRTNSSEPVRASGPTDAPAIPDTNRTASGATAPARPEPGSLGAFQRAVNARSTSNPPAVETD